MKKISLAIPSRNRPEMTIEVFEKLLYDDRISEIVIVDDGSAVENFLKLDMERLQFMRPYLDIPIFRNKETLGAYTNKKEAVRQCKNDWVLIADSDNKFDKSYIDKLYELEWKPNTIYCPEFAKPNFDYSEFAGIEITRKNVKDYLFKKNFDCLLNTGNYFVNRDTYLKIWQPNTEILADVIYFNYLWLQAGNSLYVVPGLEYEHRIHDGSLYLQTREVSMKQADDIKKLIHKF